MLYVRGIIFALLFLVLPNLVNAQTYVYSYTDPCTGVLKTINVPTNGVTVTYFGQQHTFNPNDFTNGTFDNWANSVYSSFGGNNPCGSTIGVSSSINMAQNSAMNVLSIMSSLSAISDIANMGGGGALNTDGITNSTENSGNGKKEEKKDNKSSESNSQNSSVSTNGTTPSSSSSSSNSSTSSSSSSSSSSQSSNPSTSNSSSTSQSTGSSNNSTTSGSSNTTNSGNNSTTSGSSNTTNSGNNSNGSSTSVSSQSNQSSSSNNNNSTNNSGQSSTTSNNNTSTNNSSSSGGNGGTENSNSSSSNNSGTGSNTSGGTNTSGNGNGSGTGSGSSGSGSGTGGNKPNTPSDASTTTASSEEKKSNILGGSVTSIQNSSGSGSNNKSTNKEGGKPTIVLSSDFAGFNFKTGDVSYGGKGTAGWTALNWNGTRSHGFMLDYTSANKGPNFTTFYALVHKRRIDLISLTGTTSFYGQGSLYGTLALGQMWSFPKIKNLKAIYMATSSYGNVYGTKFLGTAFIAGGMYDLKAGKRTQIKFTNLFIYAPYISYYNDMVLKSPYVIMPIVGTNIGITKKFKLNVNVGGTYALGENVLNFTVMMGTRLAL